MPDQPQTAESGGVPSWMLDRLDGYDRKSALDLSAEYGPLVVVLSLAIYSDLRNDDDADERLGDWTATAVHVLRDLQAAGYVVRYEQHTQADSTSDGGGAA